MGEDKGLKPLVSGLQPHQGALICLRLVLYFTYVSFATGGIGLAAVQEPDFHFMVLAPGLQSAWFFTAARRYWQRFRPIVLDDMDLIAVVPPDMAIAITTLARSDTAGYLRERVQRDFPYARHDELVQDDIDGMQAILDARAESGQRFG
jgi:hypothetical protein